MFLLLQTLFLKVAKYNIYTGYDIKKLNSYVEYRAFATLGYAKGTLSREM